MALPTNTYFIIYVWRYYTKIQRFYIKVFRREADSKNVLESGDMK